jgi:hypothetical protein
LQDVAGDVLQQLQHIISSGGSSTSSTGGHAAAMKQLMVLVEVLSVQLPQVRMIKMEVLL